MKNIIWVLWNFCMRSILVSHKSSICQNKVMIDHWYTIDITSQINSIMIYILFFVYFFIPMTETTKTPNQNTDTQTSKSTKTSHTMNDVVSAIPSTDQIEKKMDAVADDLTHKIGWVVSPELSSKTSHIISVIDRFIDFIEQIVSDIIGLIPVTSNTSTNDMTVKADYQEHVSRLFIFRRLRLIIQYFIMIVWSTWIMIIFVLQCLHMLLLGRRNANMHARLVRFVAHITKWSSYIMGLTDHRPELFVK